MSLVLLAAVSLASLHSETPGWCSFRIAGADGAELNGARPGKEGVKLDLYGAVALKRG